MPAQTHVFQGGYIVFRILVIRILNLFSPWNFLWRISSLGFRISAAPPPRGRGRKNRRIHSTPQQTKYEIRDTKYEILFIQNKPNSSDPLRIL